MGRKSINTKEGIVAFFYLFSFAVQRKLIQYYKSTACVCVCVCVYARVRSVARSCLTLCDPVDCSLPGYLCTEFCRQEYWSGLSCLSSKTTILQKINKNNGRKVCKNHNAYDDGNR